MNKHELHQVYKNQSEKGCVFCNVDDSLILESTQHFHLIYDPFALIPGHLLIVSRDHYGCLGEVPVLLQEECSDLREKAINLLTLVFQQKCIRYEHGRAGHCIARGVETRSCHHYHEHLIPADLSLHDELGKRFKSIPFIHEEEVCILFERYEEYLLIAEANGVKRFYITNNQEVESHLLRTLTAKALGKPERHDWEGYATCDVMLQGKQKIEDTLKLENIA